VRRGAASCRAVRGSCQWRRRSGPQHRCRHRGAVLGGRAPPGAVTRVRSGRPSGGRRREDVRTPARLVVALSAPRSRRGTSVQPVERTSSVQASSVHASGVQASSVRCPGVRCSGVRTDRPALSAAMPPRGPRRAGPGVAGCGGRRLGAAGPGAPGVRGRWSPACIGPDGMRWCGGWPCPAATRSTVAQGRRLAGVPAAAPPGRRADTGWSRARVPAGWGSPGRSRCLPVPPQGVWAVAGVVPDHGLGPRGGDHAGWS
jgi:hypothetical protein